MGLDKPAYTIQVTIIGGAQHIIEVGNQTPTGSGYYVRFDEGAISVISKDGIDSLANLISTPPYPATSTPDQTLTLTIAPESAGSTPPATP